MKVRKAVIPAAGLGTRMLPATKTVPKEMLPMVDKPVIQYIIEEAVAAGIEDILIVTNRAKSAMDDYFDYYPELETRLLQSGKESELVEVRRAADLANIFYVRQKETKGLGHAIGRARRFVGDEPFAVLLGDDIMRAKKPVTLQLVEAAEKYGASALGVQEVATEAISRYSSVKVSPLEERIFDVSDMNEKPTPEQRLSNYAILTDPDEETFILSPEVIREKYEAFAKEAEKLSVSGLRLERVGQYIPFNYNRGHVWTTEQTLEAYQQMLADARASLGEVSVQGGAIWAAPYADLLTEVPYKDSGFQFTTEAVPFYQLVMHGVRAYTATPGNLSSDLDREMLRWVEMGYMPYFELTWSSTEELMYTDYQSLFTAQYSAWLDKVSAIAADFADGDLHNLRTALMMEHTKISSDLIRVRYDNGMQVYVNYADHDQQADGLTIPAMGYLVTKEGAQ